MFPLHRNRYKSATKNKNKNSRKELETKYENIDRLWIRSKKKCTKTRNNES